MARVTVEYRCLHCTAVAFGQGEADGEGGVRHLAFGTGDTAGWIPAQELGGPAVVSQPDTLIFWAGCPACAALPLEEREPRNDGRANS